MSTIKYTIEFFSYWHCGSGQAAGADVDALTIKDSDHLPFVPGRTVKGLLREAVETLATPLGISKDGIDKCFGHTGGDKGPQKAESFFSNATLAPEEAAEIKANDNLWRHLYRKVSQTAIDENGVAHDHTLRKTEVTVPCTLHGQITSVPENMVEPLRQAMGYVKHMGLGRNRGLGRCQFSVTSVEPDAQATVSQTTSSAKGKVLKFTCHLESDIILNQKSASEGLNKTLDFIPGSCFLGIAASELYDTSTPEAAKNSFYIFHSGNVRFGDAHPLNGKVRALRTPASLFYPKGMKVEDGTYVHHFYDRAEDKKDGNGKEKQPMQLKQCRGGFYAFSKDVATKVDTTTTFSVKSAYDRTQRRAQDEQMFGYEALSAGIDMGFTVEVDDERFREAICNALTGLKRVGRSRSAQYGLVSIELAEGDGFSQTKSQEMEGGLQ